MIIMLSKLQGIKLFDNIIASTDNNEIKEIALSYGAQVPL